MKKILAAVLAMLMIISIIPMSAMAATVDFDLSKSNTNYYSIVEKSDYVLAPGATETELVVNNKAGNHRNVIHAVEVDLKNENISLMPTYKGISDDIDLYDESNWGTQVMSEQLAHIENNLGLNVVAGMNVSLSWGFDHPFALLIYKGKVLYDDRTALNASGGPLYIEKNSDGLPQNAIFVIKKDGTAEFRDFHAKLTGDEWMAQDVCMGWLVKDGKNLYKTENHTSGQAPRSVIGIKADGSVVLMQNDGRQAPYSSGFTSYEMAEMMKSFGCVTAVNCDGGGTSTFLSKRAGTNELTMKSRPSDGAERATLHGIAVISNAVSDGVLSSVVVTAKKTSIAPGGKVTLNASGIDAAGGPAELPENLEFVVEDEEFGSIVDGKFISSGKFGNAVINAVIDGKIYGSITINIQAPERIRFEDDAVEYTVKNATAGRRVELPVMGYIGNKPIEVSTDDVTLSCNAEDGTVEGFEVIPNSTYAGGKEMTVTATLNADPSVKATVKLQVYSISEIDFDFDNAQCSNYQERITETTTTTTTISWCTKCNKEAGTICKLLHRSSLENRTTEKTETKVIQEGVAKSLAWNRDMEDATEDTVNSSYVVTADPKKNDFTLEYTFGIDTTKIPLPNGVDSILNMVDSEGKYANAWETMCSLAPRITTDTLITFKVPFDKKLKVDPREIFVVSDWFEIASATVDSDNVLTVNVRWKVQYSAFDPATENPVIVCGGVKASAPGLERNQNYSFDVSGQLDYHICMLTSTGYKYGAMLALYGGGAYEKSPEAQSGQNASQGIYMDKAKVVTFKDKYTLDTTWKTDVWVGDYYYVNNKVFTNDIRYAVAKDGSNAYYYYSFDENGNATLYNGRLEHDDKMCDVVDGVPVPVALLFENGFYYVDGELATGVYRLPEVGVENPTEELCYKIQDGKIAGTHTGLYNDEGTYRYSYLGRYAAGWQMIKGEWYYFDETTLAAQTTDREFHGAVTFKFEKTGKLVSGEWSKTDYGYRYYYGPDCYRDTFATINAKTYYFYDSFRYEQGIHVIRGAVGNDPMAYVFGEDGVYIGEYKGNGLIDTTEGKFYLKDGVAQTGLYNVNGDFYYFNTSYGYAYTYCSYNVTILNGCDFTPGTYKFDENGKIISKNGYIEENGVTYYYVNSVRVKNALAQVGEDYYFFGSDGQPIKNTRYYVATSRCNLPAKQYYYFGEDGKALQGIVNGKLYINGQLAPTGIHKVGEDFYYSESGKVITARRYYAKVSNCELAAADYYHFGADGKALQGVVNGKLYVNGQPVKRGLTKIGEDYYYSESGTVITDRRYYATISNCDLPEKEYYFFGADGKALQGVVDGKLYINGQIAKRGLTEYKGDYYYSESGTVITDRRYYATISNCELAEKEYYHFGADGKALQGVVDGYLYINGQMATTGLTKFGEDYYYSESGKVIVDRRYYAAKTNCELPEKDYYYFGVDGKMLQGVIDGKLYVSGKLAPTGLTKYGEDYYYSESGEVVTGKYYAKSTNCELEAGDYYYFGDDGKMLEGVVDGYYYYQGKRLPTGLTKIGEDYYYIESGKAITGKYYASKTNCDLDAGEYYYFGEDGKMLNGVVNGYCYLEGRYAPTGLIQIGEDYYYVESGKVVTDRKYYAKVSNCDLPAGKYYYFDTDGTFKNGVYTEEDGIYYYESGKRVFAGLVKDGDDFYYAAEGGKCVTNKKVLCRKSSCVLPVNREFTFGADGKIVK